MTHELRSELLTVGELFGIRQSSGSPDPDAIYSIPIYQRNYAWGAEQINQLIDDFLDSFTESPSNTYFVGNLIVKRQQATSSGVPTFEVIDGQQRLTTLYLLLAALSKYADDLGDRWDARLRYEARDKAATALDNVLRSRSLSEGRLELRVGEDDGIIDGFNLVRQHLAAKPMARSAAFIDFLLNQVKVIRASLPEGTDLNRYFEIMNTRGEQLQQVDIVKARMMSKLPPDHLGTFAWIWEACSDMNHYVQMTLTSGDTTWRELVFGSDWERLVLPTFSELHNVWSSRATPLSGPPPASRTLREALCTYSFGHESAATPEPEEDLARFNSTIGFGPLLLHVLAIHAGSDVTETSLDDKKLIERFETALGRIPHENQAAWVQDFAVALLRLRNLFDCYILKRQYTATNGADGDWSLLRLVKDKRKPTPRYVSTANNSANEDEGTEDPRGNQRDLLLLQSMLRVTYTSPRTMRWITEVLQAADHSPHGRLAVEEHQQLLRNFARRRVQEDFMDQVEEPTGFDISRIVFTYLDYLLRDAADPNFRFVFRNSIEHFYPQNPDQEQTGLLVDPTVLDLLGNLALVSVSANSHFSNNLPKAKAENYKDTIQSQSPKLLVMSRITESEGWGTEQIRKHDAYCKNVLRDDLSTGARPSGQLHSPL